MSLISTFFIAILTGAVGLFVGGFVASLAINWYRISSFEGGSGYFMVFMALGAMAAGLVIGVVVSRIVALGADPGFFKGLGWSVLCMLLTIAVVGGASWLKADIPPTIDGEELMLHVEARWPATHTESPALVPGTSYLQLGSVTRSHVQRVSKKGALWKEDARLLDGRWTVSGAVGLFTTRGTHSLTIALNDSVTAGYSMPLRSRPTAKDSAWTIWYPRDGRSGPEMSDGVTFRYRVLKESQPVRTESVGPFDVSAIVSGFLNGPAKGMTTLDSYATFAIRFQGKPIQLASDGGGAPVRIDQVALLPSATPALLVLATPDNFESYCAVLSVNGDAVKETRIGECANAIQAEQVTNNVERFREGRYPEVPRGRMDRTTYAKAELLLFHKSVLNARTLAVHPFTAASEHTPVSSAPPLGLSPDERSFVRFAYGPNGESDPLLVVTDFVGNRVYDVAIDPVRMRFAKFEALDPAWLQHHFAWERRGDGDHLVERHGFVPIPFHGELVTQEDGRDVYRLDKCTAAVRLALLEMIVREFKGEREPAEDNDYRYPVKVEGQKINIAYGDEFAYVTIELEHGEPATDLIKRIAKRADALLATGALDKLFTP